MVQIIKIFNIENLEAFINEICHKGTREKLPKSCPSVLKKLIKSCWKKDPEARPSFVSIIEQLDACIFDCAIDDKEGHDFWKSSFYQNGDNKSEVNWTWFLEALSTFMKMSPNLKIFEGLKSMLVKNTETNLVCIEEFGNILKWFGPMNSKEPENNFLSKMLQLFGMRWFHGDISIETAQTRLAGNEPGTFLIRFSSTPGSYALSKIIVDSENQRAIVHIRISHSENEFEFSYEKKNYEYKSLQDLVNAQVLQCISACPGSYYYAKFRKREKVQGYINT